MAYFLKYAARKTVEREKVSDLFAAFNHIGVNNAFLLWNQHMSYIFFRNLKSYGKLFEIVF